MLYSTLEELTYEELEQYTYEQLESAPLNIGSSEQKKVYMVEIFKPNFDYRSSTQVSDIDIEIDYLSITKNKIQMVEIEAVAGDYIRISTTENEIDGIITGVSTKKNKTTITYKSFMDIFDIEIKVDITELATKTLEGFISDLIVANYITNSDTLQNILGLSVSILSGTGGATLDITSNITNLYKNIVYPALLQYNIVIDFAISTQQKKILCSITKNIEANKVIECDLPNILSKNIDLGVTKESYNKVIVINEDNISQQEVYFLHPDNSISATDSNRITPVIFQTVFTSISGTKTFSEVAYEKAVTILKPIEYNNLIEIEITNNDTLVNPLMLGIGQTVTIISAGMSYNSILTGKKIGKTTTLIFGAVRKELTKKLKRRL